MVESEVIDNDWNTIVKGINLFKKDNVDIEVRSAPKNLSTNALARDLFVYNKFDNNNEIASGIFVILYDLDIQSEWEGNIRIVTQSKSFIEPELANDPLLPSVSMNWFNEHFSHLQPVALKGTSTVLNTIKFSSKKTVHNLETRISWTVKNASQITKHFEKYIDYLEQLGGQG